jgi:hypothetical protein
MNGMKEEYECDDELYSDSEWSTKNEGCVVPDMFPVVRTRAKVSNMHCAVLMGEKYHHTLYITPPVLLLQISVIQQNSTA